MAISKFYNVAARVSVYLLRVCGIFLAVTLFFIGACVFRFLIIPLVAVGAKSSKVSAQQIRTILKFFLSLFVRVLTSLRIMRLRVEGLAALDKIPQPYIVVANHPSALDSVVLLSLFPNTICIAKSALVRIPVFAGILRACGFIVTGSQERTIEECIVELSEGINVLIFPEGTRTPPDSLVGEFKPGAGAVILRSGRPSVPVSITCNPRVLFKAQSWRSLPTSLFEFRVSLCDPPEFPSSNGSLMEERRLRPQIMSQLREMIVERQVL